MNRLLMSVLVTVAAGVGFAENYEYTWDAANPQMSFGDGLVTLVLDGSSVSEMRVNTARGDAVTFSGDTMAFAADASVMVNRGLLRFENAVTAVGDLNVTAGNVPAAWATADAGGTLFSDVFTTVLQGFSLDEIEVDAGHLNSNASGGTGSYNAEPYFVVRGEGWMELQLQQYLGPGNSTKVVKLRLEQGGTDVKAKILYAKYVLSTDALGIDFDKKSDVYAIMPQGVPASTSRPTYYYGCDRLAFRLAKGEVAAKVAGKFTCAGKINVSPEMAFGVVNQPEMSVSADVPEKAVFSVESDETGPADSSHYELSDIEDAWQVFAANRNISDMDLDSITGMLGGGSLSSTPLEALICYVRWEGSVLFVQLQVKPSDTKYTKGVLVKLTQFGADVKIAPSKACYYEGEAGTRSFEESGIQKVAYGGYCVKSFAADFASLSGSQVTLAGVGSSEGGMIEVGGASATQHVELIVNDKNALPREACVNVGEFGVLSLMATAGWNTGIAGGTVAYYVGPGGKLRQGSANDSFPTPFSVTDRGLTVDGGEAEFGNGMVSKWGPSSADAVDTTASTYLNRLTLKNGARCFGRAVRMGNAIAKWTVTGLSPSVWDASISLLGGSNNDGTDEFAVEDTTGSDVVDFTVTGDMKMFKSDSYKRLHVKKTGAGTMKVCGETDFTYYPLEIAGGTWMVGSATTMSTAQNVQLSGGAFASADGVSASVGKLLVGEAGGGIVAGANATVSFLDSSDQTWGGTVNITCPEGSSVRFGTSSSALTAEQQRKLRLNGRCAALTDDGTVEQRIGLMLILR